MVALTQAVLPQMRQQRRGAIVQLSNMGGQMSFAGFSAYSATKFALRAGRRVWPTRSARSVSTC